MLTGRANQSQNTNPQGNQVISANRVNDRANLAVQVHLANAALACKRGANSPLSVCINAKVTLLRASDGQELYSFPIRYCGAGRSFKDWSANDARLFRQELDNCYSQLSDAIVAEIESQQIIAPARATILAATSN